MVMNLKNLRYLIIILLAVILVCGCSAAPKKPDQIKPGIYNNRHWFSAEKIDPLPFPDTWKNALGEYQIVNPDPEGSPQDIALSNEDDVPVFSYNLPVWNTRKAKLYLTPISETEAVTLGIGRSSGETMRILNMDNEKELYFWGFKMKKKHS